METLALNLMLSNVTPPGTAQTPPLGTSIPTV
jgi:hypothetical protein